MSRPSFHSDHRGGGGSYLRTRLLQVAEEVEERHANEVADLRARLQKSEAERMQQQVQLLQLESRFREDDARHGELEQVLRDAREEIARLQGVVHESQEERTVEAAQLNRINELSRELIATRFELAAALARHSSPSAARHAPSLSLSALLGAAAQLDLQAADAILNPACVLTVSATEASDAVPDAAPDAKTAAEGAPSSTPSSGSPTRPTAGRPLARSPSSASSAVDSLRASLNQALLTVCKPRPTAFAAAGGRASPSSGAATATTASDTLRPLGASPEARSSQLGSSPDGRSSAGRRARLAASGLCGAGSPPSAASSPAAADKDTPASAGEDAAVEKEKENLNAHAGDLNAHAGGGGRGGSGSGGGRAGGALTEANAQATEEQEKQRADSECALVEALLLRGADVDASSADDGRTALHWACARGRLMAAALLIQHGASVDAVDKAGRTPMHGAAAIGDGRIAELLLRHGATDDIADASGTTAAQLASRAADGSAASTLQDHPARLAGLARKASGLYRSGAFGEAVAGFERAIAIAKGSGEVHACSAADLATLHFNCARAAIKERRHVLSLEHASAALEAKPDYANACMLVAECHMELLEFEAAASTYRRLAALEPHTASWPDCAARADKMANATPYGRPPQRPPVPHNEPPPFAPCAVRTRAACAACVACAACIRARTGGIRRARTGTNCSASRTRRTAARSSVRTRPSACSGTRIRWPTARTKISGAPSACSSGSRR